MGTSSKDSERIVGLTAIETVGRRRELRLQTGILECDLNLTGIRADVVRQSHFEETSIG